MITRVVNKSTVQFSISFLLVLGAVFFQLGRMKARLVAQFDTLREAVLSARRADQVKTHFLTAMSHELKTPLHGILGEAHGLKDTDLDTEQVKMVSVVLSLTVML